MIGQQGNPQDVIYRQIDCRNRIAGLIKMLKACGIMPGDFVKLQIVNNGVYIRKASIGWADKYDTK